MVFAAAPASAALPPGPHPPGTYDPGYNSCSIYSTDYLYEGEAQCALGLSSNLFTDFGSTCHGAYAYRGAFWDQSGRLAAFFPCAEAYLVSHTNSYRYDRKNIAMWISVYRPSQRVRCLYYGHVRKFQDANYYFHTYVIAGTQGVGSCATY